LNGYLTAFSNAVILLLDFAAGLSLGYNLSINCCQAFVTSTTGQIFSRGL
jgi:hypothetical protein